MGRWAKIVKYHEHDCPDTVSADMAIGVGSQWECSCGKLFEVFFAEEILGQRELIWRHVF